MLRARSITLCALVALTACSAGNDGAVATASASGSGGGGGSDDGGGADASTGTPSTTAPSSTTTGPGGGDGGAGGDDAASSTGSGDPDVDGDGDGFTPDEGDCNDTNAAVFPGADETCNLVDDDCDGERDEDFDVDGDGFTSCGLDCDDAVATTNPAADELQLGQNGVDDDCDGVADEPWLDGDGDGFSEAAGDCDDTQAEINPNALEFGSNNADDDCDGQVDEALQPCDGGALDSSDPMDYARAIGLCNGEVVSAQFVGTGVPAIARRILTQYGTGADALNTPLEGARMVHLSAGTADTSTKDPGRAFDGALPHPLLGGPCTASPHPNRLPDPGSCGNADPAQVCDLNGLELQVRVPSNAQSFTYAFQFFSVEYPTFRCTAFDDTFLAMLTSQAFTGNISFDANGNVVSVNNGFFDVCYDDNPNAAGGPPNLCTENPVATLQGTGYYPFTGGSSSGAGATNPLTTTSPVVPGETITLRFLIFDEGDDQLDSSVLIDNFRWSLDAADGPSTED